VVVGKTVGSLGIPMWRCVKCREQVEDNFEICWNCGTSKEGIEDPDFGTADQVSADASAWTPPSGPSPSIDATTAITELPDQDGPGLPPRRGPSLPCPRCDRELAFVGTKSFHEGFRWGGLLGDWGEFLENVETFDLYICKHCGRVEFFVSGVGDHLRPRNAPEDAQ
jgi:hypothetical protein